MNTWDIRWLEIMTTNRLEILTGIRNIDDIRAFMYPIREGWRLLEGRLCFCEKWRDEDLKDGKENCRDITSHDEHGDAFLDVYHGDW
jgi:hypothetical protein